MSQSFYEKSLLGESLLLYAARETNLKKGARFGPVIRDLFIIECCTAGYGSVVINGREFPVRPGDCYVLLPGDTVIHKADWEDPRQGVYCAAKGLSLGHLFSRAGISSAQPYAPSEVFEEVRSAVEDAILTQQETDQGARFRRNASLYRILGAMLREAGESDKNAVIHDAVGMMETRYHENLSTEDVAASVGLERSYFCTYFKKMTGIPPHRYLVRLRIRKACELMEQGGVSVGAAAESVGLNPRNFSRLFQREMGMTPVQYKNQKAPPSGGEEKEKP